MRMHFNRKREPENKHYVGVRAGPPADRRMIPAYESGNFPTRCLLDS